MRIEPSYLRELQLLKYYRLVRKWACKTNNLKDADLELLIHFDCMNTFTRDDYIKGTYIYSWDKARWERLRKEGWIDVYAYRNRTTIKYTVYKVSTKCKYSSHVKFNKVHDVPPETFPFSLPNSEAPDRNLPSNPTPP